MKIPTLPFTVTDWSQVAATTHPGVTGEALWRTLDIGDLRVQVETLAQGQVSLRSELRSIRDDIKTINLSIGEMAIAVDGHNSRLDRIEHHLGLDAKKH